MAKKRASGTRNKGRPSAVPTLSAGERSRLLRPHSNYEELTERSIDTWHKNRDAVRVPGLTPRKLAQLLARAKRAQHREQAEGARLQLASDTRLLADHEAW